jgi:hypothetical protein
LAKLRAPIQNSYKPDSPQDSANDVTQRCEISTPDPIRVVIDSVPPPKPPSDEEKAAENHKGKQNKLKFGLQIGATLITLGLLAVNVLLWSSTKKAADAAKQSADTARASLHLDQRAWIGVVVGRGELVNQKPITMPIRIINTGRTPALHVHATIVVNLLTEDEEPDFAYVPGHPKYDIEGNTILPNLPQDVAFAALPKYVDSTKPLNQILVTDAVRQGIQNGKLYTVVHGEIFYDDIFGIPHWIRFCNYAHNVVGFRQKSVANTCGSYNDVDKNK